MNEEKLRSIIFTLNMTMCKLKDCIDFISNDIDELKRNYGEECVRELIQELQEYLNNI